MCFGGLVGWLAGWLVGWFICEASSPDVLGQALEQIMMEAPWQDDSHHIIQDAVCVSGFGLRLTLTGLCWVGKVVAWLLVCLTVQ